MEPPPTNQPGNIGFLIAQTLISTLSGATNTRGNTVVIGGLKAFDCAGDKYGTEMAHLRSVSEKITHWLVMAGIGPDRFYIVVDGSEEDGFDDGFEFGFRIDYRFEDDFAEVGQEFWKFVDQLVPLHEPRHINIHSADFDPMMTICPGPNDFLLMIQPDLTSDRYEFPPQEFWTKRCRDYWHRHNAEWAEREGESRNSPLKLIASNGRRLDSPN
jgi:hypothetical protein